ncbi:Uncharacterised protein [uncultured archaeon]|nr:Uncharacterised protein [uncultured archaeon]
MNLVGKILATGLACFFLNGFGVQKSFSEDNITNEKNKYETLFLCNYGYVPDCMNNAISIGWDTNHDGKMDLKGLYAILPTEQERVFELKIIGNRNSAPTNDEIWGEKYAKFLLGVNKGTIILGWYDFDEGFSVKSLYYYKSIGTDENKSVIHKLEAIQKDTNADREFKGNEFLYKDESWGKK